MVKAKRLVALAAAAVLGLACPALASGDETGPHDVPSVAVQPTPNPTPVVDPQPSGPVTTGCEPNAPEPTPIAPEGACAPTQDGQDDRALQPEGEPSPDALEDAQNPCGVPADGPTHETTSLETPDGDVSVSDDVPEQPAPKEVGTEPPNDNPDAPGTDPERPVPEEADPQAPSVDAGASVPSTSVPGAESLGSGEDAIVTQEPTDAPVLDVAHDAALGGFVLHATYAGNLSEATFVLRSPSGLLKVYEALPLGNGLWRTTASLEDFAWESGVYTAELADAGSPLAAATCEVCLSTEQVCARLSEDGTAAILTVSGERLATASAVTFEISTPCGTVFTEAVRSDDGSWRASEPTVNLGPGTHAVVAVATLNAETPHVGEASLFVPQPGAQTTFVFDYAANAFIITTQGVFSPTGVTLVQAVLTSPTGCALELDLSPQDDGSWAAVASMDEFGQLAGTYSADFYACSDQWAPVHVASAQTEANVQTQIELVCTPSPASSTVHILVRGGASMRAGAIEVAVYNAEDGASTAIYYPTSRQSDGSWVVTIPAAPAGVGRCTVDAYAVEDGHPSLLLSQTYTYVVQPVVGGQVYVSGGDYNVSYGMAGLKVQRIQTALGTVGNFHFPRYQNQTAAAVAAFQAKNGLPATGVVDLNTWLALGLDYNEWFTLGAYVSPVQVSPSASAAERVTAMVNRAFDYLGDPYVWDAAGAPGQGIDCAGLVMQSLYAAGIDTGIINPVTHSNTLWGDHDARNYYFYGGFVDVPLSKRQRGDLIFYHTGGVIDHVAIYLGDDLVIDAYPNNVAVASIWSRGDIYGVKRAV